MSMLYLRRLGQDLSGRSWVSVDKLGTGRRRGTANNRSIGLSPVVHSLLAVWCLSKELSWSGDPSQKSRTQTDEVEIRTVAVGQAEEEEVSGGSRGVLKSLACTALPQSGGGSRNREYRSLENPGCSSSQKAHEVNRQSSRHLKAFRG